jgi:hypothetical protein
MVFASLSFLGCDLLSNKSEIDVEQAIDDTVAWANAARLTVEVYYPESWGRSPQFGPLSSGSARQGFPFTVEFTVSAAYGFAGWRAYRTADLGDKSQAALNSAAPLTAAEAAISGDTEGRASVRITITEAITLVPWCEDRPRITQTNPPLINSGISYTRGQQIKIWFATGLAADTVKFGEGFIEISGQTIGETSEPYDDPDTGVNENGDLTGRAAGASKFFKNPEYDPASGTITIRPGDGGEDGTTLPPGDIVITVTVGTNVRSPNGNGMASPVVFYYRTNTLEVKNVYTAENIWAIHKPNSGTVNAEDFFYTGAPTDRDRRLRKNVSGNYEVTLYFTVNRSNPTDMTDLPDKFKIAELHYANLAGGEVMSYKGEKTFPVTAAENTGGSAGALYRQNNSGAGGYYKITCEWATPPQPGIIRLIVLPYRDTDGDGDYADEGDIAPDAWNNAHAEGRFAAVVLDDQSPSGSANPSLSGQALVSGGVYYYGRANNTLTLAGDFSGVTDNGNVGIPQIAASMDKPWTMDNAAALHWRYRIVVPDGTSYESAWQSLNTDAATVDLSASGIPNAATARDITLKYKDSLGNETSWLPTGLKISYYQVDVGSITAYGASYNPDDNTIIITWTNPSGTSDMELSIAVNGGAAQVFDKGTATGHTITGVPRLNVSGVTSGTPVSNVYGYEISLRARSVSDSSVPVSFKIWNIGTPAIAADPARGIAADIPAEGMSVNQDNPAAEIRTQAELAAIAAGAASSGKTYVLVNDISLSGNWTPIGSGQYDSFQGNFYGNGHRISGVRPDGAQYMGLFGYVENAIIRDMEVVYDNATGVTWNGETYFGGIAGYAKGNSLFTNVLVKGEAKVAVRNSSTIYAGGIVGTTYALDNSSLPLIRNACSDLNLSGETDEYIYAGGLAGNISGSRLWDCAVRGNLSISSNATNYFATMVGGLFGCLGRGNADETWAVDCSFSGGVINLNSEGSDVYLGGAMGQIYSNVSVLNCVSAAAALNLEKYGSGNIYFGGFAGNIAKGVSLESCSASAPITADNGPSASGYLYAGSFVGCLNAGGELSGCFATGAVRTTGYSQQFTGGFIGYSFGDSSNKNAVTRCYAKGAVTMVNRTNTSLDSFAGGLGGYLLYTDITECYARGEVSARSEEGSVAYGGGLAGYAGNSTVRNCYALGDVTVDSFRSMAITGGLIGHAISSTIEYCFAQGAVASQSAHETYPIYAGGIAGSLFDSTCSHNAALNRSVTTKGATNVNYLSYLNISRIVGIFSGTGSLSHLYAFKDMQIRWGAYSDYYFPDGVFASVYPGSTAAPSASSATNKNGASTPNTNAAGGFKNASTWTGTLGFNAGSNSPAGTWNTGTIASRGYPTLANVGGQ